MWWFFEMLLTTEAIQLIRQPLQVNYLPTQVERFF